MLHLVKLLPWSRNILKAEMAGTLPSTSPFGRAWKIWVSSSKDPSSGAMLAGGRVNQEMFLELV